MAENKNIATYLILKTFANMTELVIELVIELMNEPMNK